MIYEKVRKILETISEDCPFLANYLKTFDIRLLKRTDRKKGIIRDVIVIELQDAPSALDIAGSWMKSDIQGQIKGYLIGSLGLSCSTDVRFQVANPIDIFPGMQRSASLPLDVALKCNFITSKSTFIEFMRKYDIPFLQIEGYRILGPDIGAIAVLEKLLPKFKFQHVTDFFVGTGALTSVCLYNGIPRATAMDLDVSIAKQTLERVNQRVTFVEGDSFKNPLVEPIGLAIADPTIPLCKRFVSEVVPSIAQRTDLLLLVHGHSEHTLWNESVRKNLKNHFRFVLGCSSIAMEISLCTNNEIVNDTIKGTDLADDAKYS
jgi:hypothetical protein